MAVQGEWGGPYSEDKVLWLKKIISDYIVKEGRRIDTQEIADMLEAILFDEFNVELDDESARQIADKIYKLYESLKGGSLNVYNEVISKVNTIAPIENVIPSDEDASRSSCDETINHEY